MGLYFHSHLSIGRNRAQKVQLSLVAVPENGSEVRVGNVEQVPGIGVRHALSVLQLAGRQCVPRCVRMGGASHPPPPLTDFKGTCIARCVAKKIIPPGAFLGLSLQAIDALFSLPIHTGLCFFIQGCTDHGVLVLKKLATFLPTEPYSRWGNSSTDSPKNVPGNHQSIHTTNHVGPQHCRFIETMPLYGCIHPGTGSNVFTPCIRHLCVHGVHRGGT